MPTLEIWTDAGRLNGAYYVRQIAPFEDDVAMVPVTERGSVVAQDRNARIALVPHMERRIAELEFNGRLGLAVLDLHQRGLHADAAALALAGEGAWQ